MFQNTSKLLPIKMQTFRQKVHLNCISSWSVIMSLNSDHKELDFIYLSARLKCAIRIKCYTHLQLVYNCPNGYKCDTTFKQVLFSEKMQKQN